VKNLPSEDARLDALIFARTAALATAKPDATRGAAVFAQHCAVCHRVKDTGGNLGPSLDGIGSRTVQRVIEDILDPSRNVDEAFRRTTITTADGRSVSGMRLRDEGTDVVLADATGREIRVARADVDESVVTRLSPMPSNMAAQLGEQNLVDLLEYLLQPRP
jgi:putative heme-binding domain-containing protein